MSEDKFLSQFYEAPPQEFGEALYRKLMEQETMTIAIPQKKQSRWWLGLAAAILLVAAYTIFAIQPSEIKEQPIKGSSQSPQETAAMQTDITLPVGGYITDLSEDTLTAMQEAGMVWVRWIIEFRTDSDSTLSYVASRIAQSQAAGFKVLLTIVGDPNQMRENEDTYYASYAEFVGQVAALNPDAIEVWTEMNLNRYWPTGKIDPAAYVELLNQSHTAIKAANPEVMVITGGLAPTGAQDSFGQEQVWNDDVYYQGMAEAGAAEYADCIGVHYLEGAVPPNATEGDPRDNYPTRYFMPSLTRAAHAFRESSIPLCITELGYFAWSKAGNFDIPEPFAWASETTEQQQAEWLVQALHLASTYQSKRVEMAIIWRMDEGSHRVGMPLSEEYPGYRIIRFDGTNLSCLTCDLLKASLNP